MELISGLVLRWKRPGGDEAEFEVDYDAARELLFRVPIRELAFLTREHPEIGALVREEAFLSLYIKQNRDRLSDMFLNLLTAEPVLYHTFFFFARKALSRWTDVEEVFREAVERQLAEVVELLAPLVDSVEDAFERAVLLDARGVMRVLLPHFPRDDEEMLFLVAQSGYGEEMESALLRFTPPLDDLTRTRLVEEATARREDALLVLFSRMEFLDVATPYALNRAIKRGFVRSVRLMLDESIADFDLEHNGVSFLITAIQRGRAEIVKMLLRNDDFPVLSWKNKREMSVLARDANVRRVLENEWA